MTYVQFFDQADPRGIATAGGKGANLARLFQGGFTVPPGFVITADAYRDFALEVGLGSLDVDDLSQLENAAVDIRRKVLRATISPALTQAINEAYDRLERPAVAVRSSATAEDLPTASFAGQQESYLHVQGQEDLMEAVRRCWASLWTARAIQYRARMKFDNGDMAIAVVVQKMAPHDVSGVVFTVNPVSGRKDELLINAAPGTGDALVGGETTPDQWIARRPDGAVLQATPARRGPTAQNNPFMKRRASAGCMTSPQIRRLAQLALEIESHFGGIPQDIEWSFGNNRFYVLQSRPITT